jgi:WhiB family transcriptional regulator, redox-sensing transcriptional regulator
MTAVVTLQPPAFLNEGTPACRGAGVNPEWWFPPSGEDSWEKRQAQRICRGCPLRWPCAKWAIDTDQVHGIWGATTGYERSRLRSLRRLGGRQ